MSSTEQPSGQKHKKRKRRKTTTDREQPSSFRAVALSADFNLLPHTLEDVRRYIFKLVQDSLMKYNERIAGVPVSLLDLQLAPGQEYGRIYGTDPKIKVTVHLTAHAFVPEPGHQLIGRVNKLEATYIGILVHGLFNASITADDMAGAVYNENCWRDTTNNTEIDDEIRIDSLILFEVLRIHHARGILSLDGKLIRLVLSSPPADLGFGRGPSSSLPAPAPTHSEDTKHHLHHISPEGGQQQR